MPHPPPQRQRGAAAARASLPVVLVLAVLLWGAAGVTAAAASTRNETAGQTCTAADAAAAAAASGAMGAGACAAAAGRRSAAAADDAAAAAGAGAAAGSGGRAGSESEAEGVAPPELAGAAVELDDDYDYDASGASVIVGGPAAAPPAAPAGARATPPAAAGAAAAAAAAASDAAGGGAGAPARAPRAAGGILTDRTTDWGSYDPDAAAPAAPLSAAAQARRDAAHLTRLLAMAASHAPSKPRAGRGSYIDFLLLVSDDQQVPELEHDAHFNPVVVPIVPRPDAAAPGAGADDAGGAGGSTDGGSAAAAAGARAARPPAVSTALPPYHVAHGLLARSSAGVTRNGRRTWTDDSGSAQEQGAGGSGSADAGEGAAAAWAALSSAAAAAAGNGTNGTASNGTAAAADAAAAAAAEAAASLQANMTQLQQLMGVWAAARPQFVLSVGNLSHFGFLAQLPAQYRSTWFHQSDWRDVSSAALEHYYWNAIRKPAGGSAREPLLSLFTPAYKSGKAILTPYKSLLAQTYTNWEWVIWDDSPPGHDETWAVLGALRDADPRVVVMRTDRNDGFIGSVKSRACHAASGQLLIELDHDDELLPDALEVLKDALVANPDAGFFYGETVELYEGDSFHSVDYGPNWAFGLGMHYKTLYKGRWVTAANAPRLNDKTLRHIVGVPNHVRAWRREAYLALGGHTRGLPVADDYDLVLRSLFRFPAVYVRHMTYIQYRRPDGGTFTFLRNALIQRLTKIVARMQDDSIHALLAGRGMRDDGLANTLSFTPATHEAAPQGPPLTRTYHAPTARAAAGSPHVTVVIPTYRNARGLLAALHSVYAQDYPSWELLVVGDACPDLQRTMEGLKAFILARNATVRWYNLHSHGGGRLFAPLNAAVNALLRSDWVAYLADVAVWEPDHLRSLAAAAAQDERRSFVFASVQRGGEVVLAAEPSPQVLDARNALLHHRRLLEDYGAWRSEDELGDGEQPDGDSSSTSSNADNAWELVSRWLAGGEAWGATQHASVQVAA